jgi:predicted ArsR family transcriptional regulator
MNPTKQSTEQAVLSVMSSRSKLTTAEIAAATGRGRSAVAKALAKLEKSSKVERHTGRRDGARRDPDRWGARKGKARPSAGPGTERLRSCLNTSWGRAWALGIESFWVT